MKISVNKVQLQEALQKLSSLIGSRTTLPILANVLMETEGNNLVLTTTDLEVRITTRIEAEVGAGGKTTLPAKRLLSMVTRFKDEKIIMNTNEKHHTDIKCGRASFHLLGLASDDFPLPIEFTPELSFKLQEAELSRILDQISYAVSLDDSRKVLHGILFSVRENNFTAVATDGKRLALVEKMIESINGNGGDSIVPLKSANELRRLLGKQGEVSVEICKNLVSFKTANSKLTSKLIEGNYPNYRQVIPASFTKKLTVSNAEFLSTLELVSIAVSDSSSFIKLNFNDNKLKFDAASTEIGEGSDYIDIDYQDTEISISFNPIYLADPFRHIADDKVTIKLNDGFSPVGVEGGDGFLYVIMPMRNK